MATASLFGSTGLVGSHILSTLLSPASTSTVHTISRRAPKTTGPQLNSIIEPDTSVWSTTALSGLTPAPNIVYSALGTTRAQAGGIANQWKIDHDLNVDIARAAKASGNVKTFVFISSAGTRGMVFGKTPYAKMKNGVEDTIKELDFEHAIIVRPGLILGEREAPHGGFGAGIANTVVTGMGSLFGMGVQDKVGQEADTIAKAAIHAARLAEQGKAPSKYWVLEQNDIVRLGRTEWKD
ncbi:hypothetical protein QBC46DRAFT_458151 [Diplogelasinospora grovesii]|uniref:NAD-dependent epimerase/dehydratase domain-containing protein n=1 Tax=Diplogelasinospora grovesii TaxID=303347 RepID=A0AAN6N9H2_9PEZI|nr:hypothetical protein QBC46DRAFT_458151 [Diplogelasinospora grovesii]